MYWLAALSCPLLCVLLIRLGGGLRFVKGCVVCGVCRVDWVCGVGLGL